jgi:DNA polymerase-3 subunit delta
MANLSVAETTKLIKSGDIKNTYFFYGKDILEIEKLTKLLLKKLVKSTTDGYTKLDGERLNLSELSDMAEMYPMLTEYNCILINDLNADSLVGDDLNRLLKIIEELPPTTIIIFNITGFDLKTGKRTVSAKNKKLIEFIAKKGIVCEAYFKTGSELTKSIIDRVTKEGCTITRSNAEEIAELCLYDSMLIKNELDKLCAYADGLGITKEMIGMLVSKQLDSNAFALAKAVVLLKADESMQILGELMEQRAEGIVVLSAISSAFIDLYRARAALVNNKRADNVVQDFNYKGRDFVVKNAFNSCGKISLEHLREYLKILRQADLSLKSTRTDSRVIIEKAIIEMLMVARRG